MLKLLYEFPPMASDLPAHCAAMFNAPSRLTLPTPLRWQADKWLPRRDAEKAVEHLEPIDPGMRAIVFPWACHMNFPPLPEKETLTEWREEVYRRATHAIHEAETTWAEEYFQPFLTAVHRAFPDSPGPTLIFDNETGFSWEHIDVRLRQEKTLSPEDRDKATTQVYRGIIQQIADESGKPYDEVQKLLRAEPNRTLRRQCRDFAKTLWDDFVIVNFGDNGTEWKVAPNGWGLAPKSSIDGDLSCQVFYLDDDKLFDKCMEFAKEAFRVSERSLPLLRMVGLDGQPADIFRRLVVGLHDIGYRKAWLWNGYPLMILKDPAKCAEQATRERETARIVAEATG